MMPGIIKQQQYKQKVKQLITKAQHVMEKSSVSGRHHLEYSHNGDGLEKCLNGAKCDVSKRVLLTKFKTSMMNLR